MDDRCKQPEIPPWGMLCRFCAIAVLLGVPVDKYRALVEAAARYMAAQDSWIGTVYIDDLDDINPEAAERHGPARDELKGAEDVLRALLPKETP